jgi:AraC-like DNA-binding protein
MTTSQHERKELRGWSGRVFLGIGRALYLGPAADTAVHAHHAIQLCVGLEGPFRLRANPGRWRRYEGAVVRSNVLHQFDGSGRDILLIYLEPESEEGRHIDVGGRGAFEGLPAATVASVRAQVASASRVGFGALAAAKLLEEILKHLCVRPNTGTPMDSRIARAVRRIRADPSRPRSMSERAASVSLSPRRFRDLFSQQIGMSCRQYVLWMRLFAAIDASARGASLTEAAFAAGFADAAHLTRTFRRMFGITPSSIAGSISLLEPGVG